MELIWGKCEAIYFCSILWTTQIALNWLAKFVLWRKGLCGFWPCGVGEGARRFARRVNHGWQDTSKVGAFSSKLGQQCFREQLRNRTCQHITIDANEPKRSSNRSLQTACAKPE